MSVATLAAEQRRGQAPLHAVSLRFQGTVCDEGPAQVEVARALGMPQLIRTLDETLEGQSIVAAALRLSSASPSPVLSPWQSVYTGLFRSASRLGLGRLLMGTGGDDLLNVDGSYAADRLAALDLAALWRFCRACQRTSPFRASRIARGVFWDHAALPELLRLGGRVLRRVSPALLDRVRRRRHLRASPAWASAERSGSRRAPRAAPPERRHRRAGAGRTLLRGHHPDVWLRRRSCSSSRTSRMPGPGLSASRSSIRTSTGTWSTSP